MVIISSFYNEEYLLPWWLRHHKDIFQHGVLFDYFSTDKSIKIIKKICPNWEIRKTKNKNWDFADNDQEFMDTEKEFDGYKIVLTTTEFLVGKLPELKSKPTAYALKFKRIVDVQPEKKPSRNKPLVVQKFTPFKERGDWNKRRFLHNHPDGRYGVGRHNTSLISTETGEPVIFKYVYSPWNEKFIRRKLQMKKHVNPENISRKWGLHHMWDKKRLEEEYKAALKKV